MCLFPLLLFYIENNKSTANRKTSVTNETRSQTPLQKKKIYLDLPTSAATSTLEKNLKILGAVCNFYVVSHHIVVNKFTIYSIYNKSS